ncbi:MAG: class I SAM-dependent methyltransferase [Acidobacteriota bacterium]|nr:class I SAM-dependent methyltransferase [Acidobacteriota bacterium]
MKTAFSYEAMPYPSKFFRQTNPDRLASVATLFGMNPAAVESCRFLELGCGNGSNLLTHAFNLPRARFVGVDLSENHIAFAKDAARELDISNTEFHRLDVMEMSADEFGEFDFIVAHGLYSWIPQMVREKVLSLYRQMLAPEGVGYISYNAYPGGHQREMARNILQFHTKNISDPTEKVGGAISFLGFLTENATETKIYRPILQQELKRHFEHGTADIFHDDLAEVYQPFYFHEIAAQLEKNDLQFLSEAEIQAMSIYGFAPEVQKFLTSFDDVIEREQYLDFLRGRLFRQTLVCRAEIQLNRAPVPSALDKFLLASSIQPHSENLDLTKNKAERFVGDKGFGIEIDHPLTKAALVRLGRIWGQSESFPELLQAARQMLEEQNLPIEDWTTETDTARAILFQICNSTDLIEFYLHKLPDAIETSEKPKINKLARWQLRYADNVSTLLNKDLKIDDQVSRQLLELLDGTHNRADLLRGLTKFIKTSDEIDDKQEILDDLPDWLETSISGLARIGMFVS